MDQKEILLKDLSENVGDRISKAIVAEKVRNFCKYGNVFLLFELMDLRKEIETVKEQIQTIKNSKATVKVY